jgi:hypothetical protein
MNRASRGAKGAVPAILMAVLLASSLPSLLSTGGVFASTGNAKLAILNSVPRPNAVTTAVVNESVIAGTSEVVSVDGAALSPPEVFAISFATVTFSGAEFQLYMSTNGLSQIAGSDVQYGPLFTVSDFANATDTWKSIQGSIGLGLTGTFYIGSTKSGIPMVAGPIAMDISNSYGFIKVFDGSNTGVAVTGGTLNPQPSIASIQLNPTSGPPGAPVSVTGGGFPSSTTVDINASYSTAPWVGSNVTHTTTWIGGVSTGNGYFTTAAAPMVDAGQVINPKGAGPFTTVPILLFAVNASRPSQVLDSDQKGLGSPVFRESSRGIASVSSYSSSGAPVDVTDGAFTPGYLYGNDTGSTGTVGSITVRDLPTVNAEVFGTLIIVGNYYDVGQPVTFWVGPSLTTAVQMKTSSPVIPDSTGFWNASVAIPVLSGGAHTIWIENDGVSYALSNGDSGTVTTTTTTLSSATSASTSSAYSTTSTTGQATSASTTGTPTTSTSLTTTTSPTTLPGGGTSGSESLLIFSGAIVAIIFVSYLVLWLRRPTGRPS